MSDNILASLEAIKADLKSKIQTKIDEMPEQLALKRVESAIKEIGGLMTMVAGLGIGATTAVVSKVVAEKVIEEEMIEEELETETVDADETESKVDMDALAADLDLDLDLEPVSKAA